jgi:hypothetical protein
MTALIQLQHQLSCAIAGEPEAAYGLLRARAGGSLLRIYRHAYRARLIAALRDNFGTLPRAMGDEAFDALAAAYVDQHSSRNPSIRWFGDRLAEFMREHEALVPHPAFIDLARMEWALREAFDAADAPLLSRETLAALPADAWPTLQLRVHPTVQMLQMDWAVEPAWKALQNEADDEPALPEPQALPHRLLVWRPVLDTRWRSATSALEAALLDALRGGGTFAALCERAASAVGDDAAAPQVVGFLQQWVAEGLLAG